MDSWHGKQFLFHGSYFNSMSTGSGKNLNWFFHFNWFFTNSYIDLALTNEDKSCKVDKTGYYEYRGLCHSI